MIFFEKFPNFLSVHLIIFREEICISLALTLKLSIRTMGMCPLIINQIAYLICWTIYNNILFGYIEYIHRENLLLHVKNVSTIHFFYSWNKIRIKISKSNGNASIIHSNILSVIYYIYNMNMFELCTFKNYLHYI